MSEAGAEQVAGQGEASEYVPVGVKYSAYVSLHSNLDKLVWSNQTTLHGITVLGIGSIGFVLEKQVKIGEFGATQVIAILLLIIGVLYGLTVFTLLRLAHWHRTAERELERLEHDGYFHRRRGRKKITSSQWWTSFIYGSFAIASLVGAAVLAAVG